MGNCDFKSNKNKQNEPVTTLTPQSFTFIEVIGRGGFGRVWKTQGKRISGNFAMKEMSKALIISKKSVNSIMNERKLLSSLRNPFIVNMHYAFQDREKLYLVLDLHEGGDLRYHIHRIKHFSEEQVKFFTACIVTGLEFVHSNGILHRDIKPENLVFGSDGYLHITDFGVARVWRTENSQDTSGTPGYMAPEVMCRQDHGVAVDFYALGVIIHELMLQKRPYVGKSRKEIREQILARQVQISANETDWSVEAVDLVNRLIQRKPAHRLGLNGAADVKAHPWFDGFQWNALRARELKSPFIPSDDRNYDVKVVNAAHNYNESAADNALALKQSSVQDLFAGYHYDITKSGNETPQTTSQSSFSK